MISKFILIVVSQLIYLITTVVPNLATGTNTPKIENLVVPEVVQSGSSSLLFCQYTVTDDLYTLQWLFNHSDVVYQWSPHAQPKISGHLDGRIDLTYTSSTDHGGALHLMDLAPDLSGDYTCRITNIKGQEAQQTKSMLVFSLEEDFVLELRKPTNEDIVEIKCYARGLYPQPEMTIECDGEIIKRQHQRVWRNEGLLYAAEGIARIAPAQGACDQITCRLQLPHAGYTAIKKEFLYAGNKCSSSIMDLTSPKICMTLLSFAAYL